MIKVLLTHKDVDVEQYDCISGKLILTWFDLLNVSKDSLINTKQWNKYKSLRHTTDENIEILNQGDYYCTINISSIVRIENVTNETFIHLDSGCYLSTLTPIVVLEELLREHNFFLIHPNHLINVVHMKSFVKCNAFVTMSNTDAIPVDIGNDNMIIDFLSKRDII